MVAYKFIELQVYIYLYIYISEFRIRLILSWSGSGSGQMIRIRQYPDPKHCYISFYPIVIYLLYKSYSFSIYYPSIYPFIYLFGLRGWGTWSLTSLLNFRYTSIYLSIFPSFYLIVLYLSMQIQIYIYLLIYLLSKSNSLSI